MRQKDFIARIFSSETVKSASVKNTLESSLERLADLLSKVDDISYIADF